jgi:ABC-type bacteriocin/lantibiotic exporter with double-glycine peptidase domain
MRIKSWKRFNESKVNKINLFIQPNEWSCGPSSLKMVLDYINNENNNIEDLIKLGNVDSVFGSTGRRMRSILDGRGVDYEFIKSFDCQSIIKGINSGYVFVMLVFLGKYPHWILVSDYENDKFIINDPYLGKEEMNEVELRDYYSVKNTNIYSIGTKFLVPNRIIKINTKK